MMSTEPDDEDIFIKKCDSDGNFLWVKRIGGVDLDKVSDMDIDPAVRMRSLVTCSLVPRRATNCDPRGVFLSFFLSTCRNSKFYLFQMCV